jgi:DNA-binding ferritin-like protein (Dps family)
LAATHDGVRDRKAPPTALVASESADGTPVRAVVGDDTVEFAETFLLNDSDGQSVRRVVR